MRTLILGDIHGGYKALLQVFERSKFDYENDELIVLGDVCDGWPETKQCIDELLKVKNLSYIIGNHDIWLLNYAKRGDREKIWVSQGGWNTLHSYDFNVPEAHIKFLESSMLWMDDEETGNLYVHGGINPSMSVESHEPHTLLWDRSLIDYARDKHLQEERRAADTGKPFIRPKITKYNEIFIGHTTTSLYGTLEPMHYCNVWNLDTGAGWEGKLTIMDLATKQYWQSDIVETLYPGSSGRGDYSYDNPEVLEWLRDNAYHRTVRARDMDDKAGERP